MSDEIIVSLIGSGTTILVGILMRILSHFEHKKTERQVNEIHIKLNGEFDKKISDAVKKALND